MHERAALSLRREIGQAALGARAALPEANEPVGGGAGGEIEGTPFAGGDVAVIHRPDEEKSGQHDDEEGGEASAGGAEGSRRVGIHAAETPERENRLDGSGHARDRKS